VLLAFRGAEDSMANIEFPLQETLKLSSARLTSVGLL
jgi:hypothetical protein